MNTVEQLKKYKELLDANIISQEEFEEKKKELLNSTEALDETREDVNEISAVPKKKINTKFIKIAVIAISIIVVLILGIIGGIKIVEHNKRIAKAEEFEKKIESVMDKYDLSPYAVKYVDYDYDVYAEGFESLTNGKALECLEEIDDIMGNFTNVHPGLDIEYSYWRVSTATVLVNKEHGGNYKKAGIYCNQYGSECVYESYN